MPIFQARDKEASIFPERGGFFGALARSGIGDYIGDAMKQRREFAFKTRAQDLEERRVGALETQVGLQGSDLELKKKQFEFDKQKREFDEDMKIAEADPAIQITMRPDTLPRGLTQEEQINTITSNRQTLGTAIALSKYGPAGTKPADLMIIDEATGLTSIDYAKASVPDDLQAAIASLERIGVSPEQAKEFVLEMNVTDKMAITDVQIDGMKADAELARARAKYLDAKMAALEVGGMDPATVKNIRAGLEKAALSDIAARAKGSDLTSIQLDLSDSFGGRGTLELGPDTFEEMVRLGTSKDINAIMDELAPYIVGKVAAAGGKTDKKYLEQGAITAKNFAEFVQSNGGVKGADGKAISVDDKAILGEIANRVRDARILSGASQAILAEAAFRRGGDPRATFEILAAYQGYASRDPEDAPAADPAVTGPSTDDLVLGDALGTAMNTRIGELESELEALGPEFASGDELDQRVE